MRDWLWRCTPASGKSQPTRSAAAAWGLVGFICLARAAHADPTKPGAIDPSIGKVEVTLDLPKDKPYVGEMIMLRMRSFIRADIALDAIKQPPLIDFDSQQLGRDKPIQAMVDGFEVAGFERDVAIFPQQSGRLIIDPFVRSVTIVTDDMQRVTADFASKPIYVDVQNNAGVVLSDTWWLPAKAVTIADQWSVPPDEIKPGTLARRTVVVTAVGLPADRLPPAPDMLAPGIIAFKGPATRETIITEDGPVARATYQWDVRPVSASPAQLPAIHVAWFDTAERRVRDAAIPEVWMAYVGTLVHTSHEEPKTWAQTYLAPGPILAGLAGFGWTAAFAGFLLTAHRRPRHSTRRRALQALDRAARFNDEPGFRAALADLARDDAWTHVATVPLVLDRLADLDRARFARQGGTPPPLKPLAADIRRLMTTADETEATAADSLPRLDGPVVVRRPTSWRAWLG